eukprot:7391659-Prymnesium_polylepis.2
MAWSAPAVVPAAGGKPSVPYRVSARVSVRGTRHVRHHTISIAIAIVVVRRAQVSAAHLVSHRLGSRSAPARHAELRERVRRRVRQRAVCAVARGSGDALCATHRAHRSAGSAHDAIAIVWRCAWAGPALADARAQAAGRHRTATGHRADRCDAELRDGHVSIQSRVHGCSIRK